MCDQQQISAPGWASSWESQKLWCSCIGVSRRFPQVLPYAPYYPILTDYTTFAMQLFDTVMSQVGVSDVGLGPAWSAIERVAHAFHMVDLWEKIKPQFQRVSRFSPPSRETCDCLMDVANNGVQVRVLRHFCPVQSWNSSYV